jgi:hypothetical protein
MTPTERVLFRMLENRSLPEWRAETYYYSTLYQSDCLHLRKWMKDNEVPQKFMLYGDTLSGGVITGMNSHEMEGL